MSSPVGAVPRSCVPPARFPCPTVLTPHSTQCAQQPQGPSSFKLGKKTQAQRPPLHSLVLPFFTLFVRHFST